MKQAGPHPEEPGMPPKKVWISYQVRRGALKLVHVWLPQQKKREVRSVRNLSPWSPQDPRECCAQSAVGASSTFVKRVKQRAERDPSVRTVMCMQREERME